MSNRLRWLLIGVLFVIVVVAPIVFYRAVYAHGKRLRVVVPGRFYRSGQMTAAGFTEAIEQLHIRTVINVQDDFPDPDLPQTFWNRGKIKESELCRRLGVQYKTLRPDVIPRGRIPEERPAVIEDFLRIMDDPANYPVLIHCRAGLHRTGILSAVYRMEYQGWSSDAAYRELKAHGFGEWACTAANDYVYEYVLTYRPGQRQQPKAEVSSQQSEIRKQNAE